MQYFLYLGITLALTHLSAIAETKKFDPTKKVDHVARQLLKDFPEYYLQAYKTPKESDQARLRHAALILKGPAQAGKVFGQITGRIAGTDKNLELPHQVRTMELKHKEFSRPFPKSTRKHLKEYRKLRTMMYSFWQRFFSAGNVPNQVTPRTAAQIKLERAFGLRYIKTHDLVSPPLPPPGEKQPNGGAGPAGGNDTGPIGTH